MNGMEGLLSRAVGNLPGLSWGGMLTRLPLVLYEKYGVRYPPYVLLDEL